MENVGVVSKYPQVLLNANGDQADEKLAPLINMIARVGFVPRYHNQGNPSAEDFDQAWVSFANAEEALQFLIQTAVYFDFQLGSNMILTVHRPLGDDLDAPAGGMVTWHPGFTDQLIDAWNKAQP